MSGASLVSMAGVNKASVCTYGFLQKGSEWAVFANWRHFYYCIQFCPCSLDAQTDLAVFLFYIVHTRSKAGWRNGHMPIQEMRWTMFNQRSLQCRTVSLFFDGRWFLLRDFGSHGVKAEWRFSSQQSSVGNPRHVETFWKALFGFIRVHL